MTKQEAWDIINANVKFNIQFYPSGMTADERSILDNRKRALANAWAVVGELVAEVK